MPERAQAQLATSSTTAAIQIAAVSGTSSMLLKSWLPEDATAAKRIVLDGHELPSQVGATLYGPIRFLSIGPGEWLIISREYTPSRVREYLAPDLPKHSLALVDLTDGLAGLEVRGSHTPEVLSKGCGLDLHPRTVPAGHCTRTRFAQIPIVIEYLNEPPRFELYLARSYLHYLHSWLSDATAEFGYVWRERV